MQNSAVICIFSVFERIYSFWLTSVQKIKSVSISWNLVPRLIWICRIQWCRSLFSIFDKLHFLGKLGPKIQSSLFKVKYGTASNSNKKNSMVIVTFLFWTENIFSEKSQNCQFKLKFGIKENTKVRNSMVVFIFSVFDGKYPFWGNIGQKLKLLFWRVDCRLPVFS